MAHRLYSEAFLRRLDTTFHDGAVCWLSCEKSSECAVAVAHSWNGFRLRGRAGLWFGVSGVTVVAVHSRRRGSLNGRDRKCCQQGSSCASFIRAKANVVLRAWLHIQICFQTPSKYPSRPFQKFNLHKQREIYSVVYYLRDKILLVLALVQICTLDVLRKHQHVKCLD